MFRNVLFVSEELLVHAFSIRSAVKSSRLQDMGNRGRIDSMFDRGEKLTSIESQKLPRWRKVAAGMAATVFSLGIVHYIGVDVANSKPDTTIPSVSQSETAGYCDNSKASFSVVFIPGTGQQTGGYREGIAKDVVNGLGGCANHLNLGDSLRMGETCQAVNDFVKVKGVKNLFLVGDSEGGAIALQLANCVESVRGVEMVATPHDADDVKGFFKRQLVDAQPELGVSDIFVFNIVGLVSQGRSLLDPTTWQDAVNNTNDTPPNLTEDYLRLILNGSSGAMADIPMVYTCDPGDGVVDCSGASAKFSATINDMTILWADYRGNGADPTGERHPPGWLVPAKHYIELLEKKALGTLMMKNNIPIGKAPISPYKDCNEIEQPSNHKPGQRRVC